MFIIMSNVSELPIVTYSPYPLAELSKDKTLLLSKSKDVSDGIATVLSILNILAAAAVGSFSINKVTVASAVACVLVTIIDFIVPTFSPGAISSTSTPVDPVIL